MFLLPEVTEAINSTEGYIVFIELLYEILKSNRLTASATGLELCDFSSSYTCNTRV